MILFLSCEDASSNQPTLTAAELDKKNSLVKKVMAVHDEAMPWLDDIHQLKKEIVSRTDSTNSDSTTLILNQLIFSLDSADEAMMSWMRVYREPNNSVSIDSMEVYLNDQFEKATKMRNYMYSTIEETRQFIEQ